MKNNLPLILNAVLGLAVAVLFYLHFSSPATGGTTVVKEIPAVKLDKNIKLAYFETDSLKSQYQFFKDQEQALEQQNKQLSAQLEGQAKALENEMMAFQKEVQAFQEKAQYLTITDQEAKAKTLEQRQQALLTKQQNLAAQQQKLSGESVNNETKALEKIYNSINKVTKTLAEEKGYTFIMGKSATSGVWYADSTYNITKELMDALNADYETSKGGK